MVSEAGIAGLVPLVASLAEGGDEAAARITQQAAAHLVELAVALLARLGELPIYLSGGVWNAPAMGENIRRLLGEAGHAVEASRGKGEPWEGMFRIWQGGILD